MNKQLTTRETQLMLIVPAALIVCIYGFIFERPHRATLDGLRQATEVARRNPISEDQLRIKKREVYLLSEQIKVEQRRAATHPASKLPARWTSPAGRLEALAAIGAACESHGLAVITTSRQTDATNNAMAPKPLQDFASAIAHEGKSPVPQVWRVEVLGSYADLLAMLNELDKSKAFIVPLGVSMDSLGDDTNYRHWSVWFWV